MQSAFIHRGSIAQLLCMAAALVLLPASSADAGRGGAAGSPPLEATAAPVDATAAQKDYFSSKFGLSLANIYWGEFHSHTSYSLDAVPCSALSPDGAYRYARDTEKLSFVALSDHAEMRNKSAIPAQDRSKGLNNWQSVLRIGAKYNNEDPAAGRLFIVFPGWEYTNTHGLQDSGQGSAQGYGHKTVIFKRLDAAAVPADEYGAFHVPRNYLAEDAEALWAGLQAYRPVGGGQPQAFTIVHTPAHVGEGEGDPKDHRTDWNIMDAAFVRHVEIYSKWGGSEGPPPAGVICAEEDEPFEYERSPEGDPLSVRSILLSRWVDGGDAAFRLGFLGGTDNHIGMPTNPEPDQCGFPFRGGKTGIAAKSLTRNELWSNLTRRHTLAASTGVEMPVLFAVETAGRHLLMGDQGSHNGTVRVRALASSNVEKLELIVNGCVEPSATVNGCTLDKTMTLPLTRHYIYVRASLHAGDTDLRKAWTSPVYLKP